MHKSLSVVRSRSERKPIFSRQQLSRGDNSPTQDYATQDYTLLILLWLRCD